jgi:hypothetical protein
MNRHLCVVAVLLSMMACVRAEEKVTPEKVFAVLRELTFKVSEDDQEDLKSDDEKLTFDQGKDEVIWIRTYGDDKIIQVYEIVKDRAKIANDTVIIPLKWLSMKNPNEKNYNPDKHDVGLRVTWNEKDKWKVQLYAIDEKGKEVDLSFLQKKD